MVSDERDIALIRMRKNCGRCIRPARVCICAALPSCPHHISVQILLFQHPAEAKASVKTADLLPLCLDNVSMVVTRRPSSSELLQKVIDAGNAFVLWPGKGAVNVSDVKAPVKSIIVFDGTWTSAKRMMDKSPSLQGIPKIRLDGGQGIFHVRPPPSAIKGAVSTAEAVAMVLDGLGEKEEVLNSILKAVQRVSDLQLLCKKEKQMGTHQQRGEHL